MALNTKSKLLYYYIEFVLLYGGLIFMLPPDPIVLQKYHLTLLSYRVVLLTIIIPYAAIWFAAFYGSNRLLSYAKSIQGTKDGKHVRDLALGATFLAFWLPVTALVNVTMAYWLRAAPNILGMTVVIRNYLNLLFPFVAFLLIAKGAHGLSKLAKQQPSQHIVKIQAACIIVIGVLYAYLVTNTHTALTIYHLPILLVLLTLVVPYIFMWFIDIGAAYEVYLYHRKIAGSVYRQSWRMMAWGVAALIGTSVILQYLVTIPTQINRLSLNWLLIVLYVILALLSLGFVLIALGAKKLQKIEEV